jgi:hypothetical protein
MVMREGECARGYAGFTTDGTSETVAKKSHMTPLRMETMSIDWQHHKEGEGSLSHLFPKKVSNPECPAFVAAQEEQSNEHGEKQDYVRDDENDDIKFAGIRVKYCALYHGRAPVGAELQMDKPRMPKILGTAYSPARYLM